MSSTPLLVSGQGPGQGPGAGEGEAHQPSSPGSYASRVAASTLVGGGPPRQTVEVCQNRVFDQILSDSKIKRNVLEVIVKKPFTAGPGGSQPAPAAGPDRSALSFDDFVDLVFLKLGIKESDLVSFNHAQSHFTNKEVGFKAGIDISRYLLTDEPFRGHLITTKVQSSRVVRVTFRDVPHYISNEELFNIIRCYGKEVDYNVMYSEAPQKARGVININARSIMMELGEKLLPSYLWLEGPLPGDRLTRISASYPGQMPWCYSCLKAARLCPADGRGRACAMLPGTTRARQQDFMLERREKDSFMTLKEQDAKDYPPLDGSQPAAGQGEVVLTEDETDLEGSVALLQELLRAEQQRRQEGEAKLASLQEREQEEADQVWNTNMEDIGKQRAKHEAEKKELNEKHDAAMEEQKEKLEAQAAKLLDLQKKHEETKEEADLMTRVTDAEARYETTERLRAEEEARVKALEDKLQEQRTEREASADLRARLATAEARAETAEQLKGEEEGRLAAAEARAETAERLKIEEEARLAAAEARAETAERLKGEEEARLAALQARAAQDRESAVKELVKERSLTEAAEVLLQQREAVMQKTKAQIDEIRIACKEGEVNVNVLLADALKEGVPNEEVFRDVTRSVFLPEFELHEDQQSVIPPLDFLEHAEQLTAGRGAAGHGAGRGAAGGAELHERFHEAKAEILRRICRRKQEIESGIRLRQISLRKRKKRRTTWAGDEETDSGAGVSAVPPAEVPPASPLPALEPSEEADMESDPGSPGTGDVGLLHDPSDEDSSPPAASPEGRRAAARTMSLSPAVLRARPEARRPRHRRAGRQSRSPSRSELMERDTAPSPTLGSAQPAGAAPGLAEGPPGAAGLLQLSGNNVVMTDSEGEVVAQGSQ